METIRAEWSVNLRRTPTKCVKVTGNFPAFHGFMKRIHFLVGLACVQLMDAGPVRTTEELLAAVRSAGQGMLIELDAGTYRLERPLELKSGVSIQGAGEGKTIITHAAEWRGNPATLPDPETDFRKFDKSGYLIHLADDATDVSVSDLTLTGPQLHGGIYGWANRRVHLHGLRFENFQYSGFRSYQLAESKIDHCVFVDAGQRWENGKPGVGGGITGGGIFAIWIADSEISNNRFLRTKTAANEHYYGIKGRQGKRLKIHHNTIETNFSIEFPFENDEDVEISNNVLHGTVSIPKHAGGPVPASGRTFHIHHNWFRDSYSIEFVRNGVEISHNLFDFDPAKDHGNLISAFGDVPAPGPAVFHNNLVNNPGRGVMWMNEIFGNLTVRNNHIVARTTVTPREEGLFGFHQGCDFSTFVFENNRIECEGKARPLFRNEESAKARLSNNQLVNVESSDLLNNPKTAAKAGLEAPLKFKCGVDGEVTVDGWTAKR